MDMNELFGEPVSTYTTQDGLDDGHLVEVNAKDRMEAGYKIPVVLTRNVYEDCVAWDNGVERWVQDETGRMWDILWLSKIAFSRSDSETKNAGPIVFELKRIPRRGCGSKRWVTLWMMPSFNELGEPYFTIMKPEDY